MFLKTQAPVLKKLADIPVRRHFKIKKNANPFDDVWNEYFQKRAATRHNRASQTAIG
jgi:RNA-directed DNA polymerase